MAQITTYTLEDFKAYHTIPFDITQDVLDRVERIKSELVLSDYKCSTVFEERKKSRPKQNKEVSKEDWEALRTFEPTASVIKKKSNVEQCIGNVNSALAKVNDKIYEKLCNEICDNINILLEDPDFTTDVQLTFTQRLVDICYRGGFSMKYYAIILCKLIEKYNFIANFVTEKLENYLGLFTSIIPGNPDVDYEMFCKLNDQKENRKNFSKFIIYLACEELLDFEYVNTIIEEILNLFDEKLNDTSNNNKHYIEEFSDIIYAIINELNLLKKPNVVGDSNIKRIMQISELKEKEHVNLSNKALFKFMDITDLIQKQIK